MINESSTEHYMRLIFIIGGVTLVVAMFCLLVTMGRNYLGLSRANGWLLGIVVVGAAIGTFIYRNVKMPGEEPLHVLAAGCLVLFGAPLVIKIYRAWIGVYVTQSEKAPGTAGIRAWLSPANIILSLLVSFCAAYGFYYQFFAIFTLTLLILLAYPIANSMSQNTNPPQSFAKQETLTSERERVLSLLDAGKITAEESAELLNALAATVQQPEPAAGNSRISRVTPGQKLALIGAALVLIGFFLPWFSVNPAKELERMTGQMGNFNNIAQQFATSSGGNIPFSQNGGNSGFPFKIPTVDIAGGDVPHGLGWLVLALSVGVAILPFIGSNFEMQINRAVELLALSGGLIILLYLLSSNLRFLNAGIIVVIAGYLIEFTAVIRNMPAVGVQKEIRL